MFLPAANFHGHELQVLVKMNIEIIKISKDFLRILTYFVVENFYYRLYFFEFRYPSSINNRVA